MALGFAGGILHILNHALFKCLLFYAAGSVYHSTHTVDLERLGGLARRLPWTTSFFLLGGLAISALPPFNGFVSEFLIYSGLFSHSAPPGAGQLILLGVAALLAFVGGVSALAVTRSFGLGFLGQPRDPSVHIRGEAPASMQVAMGAHALGVLALGLVPTLGLRIVSQPTFQFLGLIGASAPDLGVASRVLGPLGWLAAVLLGLLGLLLAIRLWLARRRDPAPAGVTWACGYAGVSARMQYTGSSFAQPFGAIFHAFLPQLRRERLPEGPFPEKAGQLNTHSVDAVERRLFTVLGNGERLAIRLVARLSEQPRFAFGLGLIVLVALVGFATASPRAWP